MTTASAAKVFELEKRLQTLVAEMEDHKIECATHKAKPVEISKMMWSWQALLIIGAIIAGQVASTWGLRSDVATVLTQMAAQKDLERVTTKAAEDREAARAKLDEAKAELQKQIIAQLAEAVGEFKKSQEMQRVQLESLSKTVIAQRR